MNLARFSVNNSLAVNLLSVVIIAAGILAGLQIPREAFPKVNFGLVSISTVYPGATPKEVEKLITIPIEDELRDVDGLDKVDSISLEGLSQIFVRIDIDEKNTDQIVTDVQRAVDRVSDLPSEAENPLVKEINTHDEPILIVSLSGSNIWKIRELAKELEDTIEDVPGIARADKIGWKDTQVWVNVEPEKLAAYYVSFEEIASSLRTRNTNVPGGKLYIDGEQHVIRTIGEFETPEDISKVVIRANDQGRSLTIGDVAKVHYALEEADQIDKTNGHLAVNIMVVKKEKADTLRLVDKSLKKVIEKFKNRIPPDVQLTAIEDLPLKYVRKRLSILVNNGITGFFLLILMMWFFLGFRIALLASLGIPISFCLTAISMWSMGTTINLIAMFGLIIVLDMLVDDAIVISENSFRYIQSGMSPREATIKGTNEVISGVTATILTTVTFFSSLFFFTGILGKFIWVIPAVVIVSLLGSLFESAVILPSHIADFGISKKHIGQHASSRAEQNKLFIWMRKHYLFTLKWAIRRRWQVFAGMIGLALGTLLLFQSAMKFVLFPSRGVEVFFIRAEAPVGTYLEQVEERMRPIEKAVTDLPKSELDHFVTLVGAHQEDVTDPTQRRGRNLGQIQVYLSSSTSRKREAKKIIEDLRKQVGKIEGLQVTFQEITTGPPVGKAVEAHIRGENFDTLEKIADDYKSFLDSLPGVSDIRDNYETGKPEIQIIVDEQAARQARIGISEIGRAVRFAYEGIPATSIRRTDEEIEVLVRFPEESRQNPETLKSVMVRNDMGDLIPLDRIAKSQKIPGISYITHRDFKRVISVTAGVDEKRITSGEANRKLIERFQDLQDRHPGYSTKYGGEQEETLKSFRNFGRSFIISILVCYAIIAVTFNSMLHPFLIMIAIPFGLIGVIWTSFLHRMPISFMTMIGTIGLSGVVVNSSILLVEFILKQLKANVPLIKAVVKAARLRFRPVMLTTLSTVAGVGPTAYGIGGLDPFLQPAALAMTWGLVCASSLTLILIPCLYLMERDIRLWMNKHSGRQDTSLSSERGLLTFLGETVKKLFVR